MQYVRHWWAMECSDLEVPVRYRIAIQFWIFELHSVQIHVKILTPTNLVTLCIQTCQSVESWCDHVCVSEPTVKCVEYDITLFSCYQPLCSTNINKLFHPNFQLESVSSVHCYENKQRMLTNRIWFILGPTQYLNLVE